MCLIWNKILKVLVLSLSFLLLRMQTKDIENICRDQSFRRDTSYKSEYWLTFVTFSVVWILILSSSSHMKEPWHVNWKDDGMVNLSWHSDIAEGTVLFQAMLRKAGVESLCVYLNYFTENVGLCVATNFHNTFQPPIFPLSCNKSIRNVHNAID